MAGTLNTDLFDVVQAGGTDDNRIAVLSLHQAVLGHPTKGDLSDGQIVLLRDHLNRRKSVEVGIVPVPVAVILHED